MYCVRPALILGVCLALCTISPASAADPSITVPANLAVAPGSTVTFSFSLATPAPGGGVTVVLSSSNPSVASVWPPSMVIPMEMTGPPRLVPTITGHGAGIATISAVAPGYATGKIQVQVTGGSTGAPTIGFTPASLDITGTATKNLTLLLSAPAPSAVTVNLSSGSAAVATVPASVSIPAGSTTATVPVTGVAAGSTNITAATTGFGTATASVIVSAQGGGGGGSSGPRILAPASLTVVPGDIREISIELSAPAPGNGVFVAATCSDTSKLTLSQPGIDIPGGSTSAPRKVTTVYALSAGAVTINLSAPGYTSASVQVQITGGTPSPGGGTMSLSPASLTLTGSETKNLVVSLSSPAGSGGLTVNLSSSNPAVAGVPSVVNIAGGTASQSVLVTGAGAGSATITATASNYGSATANVTVSSPTPPPVDPPKNPTGPAIVVPSSLSLFPGDSTILTVALPSAANSNVPITLTSSDPSKVSASPATFEIPAGATSARRVEARLNALAIGSATVTASAPGYGNGTIQVQVKSAAPGGTMSLSPATTALTSGGSQNLTLTLTGTLPPNGLVVYLSSSNTSAATVPASVTVPANSTTASFTLAAGSPGDATITASAANFGSATAAVAVSSMPQINLPQNVSPAVGETVNFPVTLNAAAPANAVITLQSSDTSRVAVAPSSITIMKGAMSASGVVTTVSGVGAGSAMITATSPGYANVSRQVSVTGGSSPALSMGLSPGNLSIAGFVTKNLTLTLSAAAPPGGVIVSVASANGSIATAPSILTVPAQTTSLSIPVTGVSVGSTVITVSSNGMQNATATVTVTPAGSGKLILPASWVAAASQTTTLQVTLDPVAPAAGVTLSFSSSDPSKATIATPTVAVTSGAAAANVLITGVAAGTTTISVSAPGYTGASTQVQVSAAPTGSGVFIPGVVAINTGITDTVQLSVGPLSPAGLTATLASSNPAVASVPASVVFPANASTVSVPVKALTAGTTIVTATVPGFGVSTLRVTVLSMDDVKMEWHGACWVPVVYQGETYWRHAMDYKLSTPKPVILQATLFYTTSNCTGPGDNMNDFDATTGPGHSIQGFLNYPYPVWKPTSAIFWIGARTADGKCPPGSPCSGCLAYTASTPMCDTMP